jgi:hypothetical protein
VSWYGRVLAFLGMVAGYAVAAPTGAQLSDKEIKRRRGLFGGNIQLPVWTKTRWYQADVERAIALADAGDLTAAAKLWRAAQGDGFLRGKLATRTGGLVRLPRRFRGRTDIVEALERRSEVGRSVFDEMHPPAELSALVADGIGIGVGVGEYLEVPGRDYPVFCRLDPEFLRFRWQENRWYYASAFGEIAITPGDGHWVLYTPGGRLAPWLYGLWRAIGPGWIRKEHASRHKDNWEGKLANPARVAVAPQGSDAKQRQGWFQKVMAWGTNTVFGLLPGYDVKLLESNGRGYESFIKTIEAANVEFAIALCGQTVTTDGGSGFANADIHKSVQADLVKEDAESLAHCLNTQGLPAFIIARFGEDALRDGGATVEWDVAPPKDRTAEATTATQTAAAISALTTALAPYDKEPDVEAMCLAAGIPIRARHVAELEDAANDKPGADVVPIRGAA